MNPSEPLLPQARPAELKRFSLLRGLAFLERRDWLSQAGWLDHLGPWRRSRFFMWQFGVGYAWLRAGKEEPEPLWFRYPTFEPDAPREHRGRPAAPPTLATPGRVLLSAPTGAPRARAGRPGGLTSPGARSVLQPAPVTPQRTSLRRSTPTAEAQAPARPLPRPEPEAQVVARALRTEPVTQPSGRPPATSAGAPQASPAPQKAPSAPQAAPQVLRPAPVASPDAPAARVARTPAVEGQAAQAAPPAPPVSLDPVAAPARALAAPPLDAPAQRAVDPWFEPEAPAPEPAPWRSEVSWSGNRIRPAAPALQRTLRPRRSPIEGVEVAPPAPAPPVIEPAAPASPRRRPSPPPPSEAAPVQRKPAEPQPAAAQQPRSATPAPEAPAAAPRRVEVEAQAPAAAPRRVEAEAEAPAPRRRGEQPPEAPALTARRNVVPGTTLRAPDLLGRPRPLGEATPRRVVSPVSAPRSGPSVLLRPGISAPEVLVPARLRGTTAATVAGVSEAPVPEAPVEQGPRRVPVRMPDLARPTQVVRLSRAPAAESRGSTTLRPPAQPQPTLKARRITEPSGGEPLRATLRTPASEPAPPVKAAAPSPVTPGKPGPARGSASAPVAAPASAPAATPPAQQARPSAPAPKSAPSAARTPDRPAPAAEGPSAAPTGKRPTPASQAATSAAPHAEQPAAAVVGPAPRTSAAEEAVRAAVAPEQAQEEQEIEVVVEVEPGRTVTLTLAAARSPWSAAGPGASSQRRWSGATAARVLKGAGLRGRQVLLKQEGGKVYVELPPGTAPGMTTVAAAAPAHAARLERPASPLATREASVEEPGLVRRATPGAPAGASPGAPKRPPIATAPGQVVKPPPAASEPVVQAVPPRPLRRPATLLANKTSPAHQALAQTADGPARRTQAPRSATETLVQPRGRTEQPTFETPAWRADAVPPPLSASAPVYLEARGPVDEPSLPAPRLDPTASPQLRAASPLAGPTLGQAPAPRLRRAETPIVARRPKPAGRQPQAARAVPLRAPSAPEAPTGQGPRKPQGSSELAAPTSAVPPTESTEMVLPQARPRSLGEALPQHQSMRPASSAPLPLLKSKRSQQGPSSSSSSSQSSPRAESTSSSSGSRPRPAAEQAAPRETGFHWEAPQRTEQQATRAPAPAPEARREPITLHEFPPEEQVLVILQQLVSAEDPVARSLIEEVREQVAEMLRVESLREW